MIESEQNKSAPKFPLFLLQLFADESFYHELTGDLEELYADKVELHGAFRAKIWLWRHVLKSIPQFISQSLQWSLIMFRNYLKIAIRNIKKYKAYSAINILGLAIGMACCIILVLYINSELSIDNYHKNRDRIYRLGVHVKIGGIEQTGSASNALCAKVLKDEYPEVINAARFRGMQAASVQYNEKRFHEDEIMYADNAVFDIFTWPLIKGAPQTALTVPYSVVISEELAEKYFGDEEPLGKILLFNNEEQFTVTGVMENIPEESHIDFDALCSFNTLPAQIGEDASSLTDWISFNFRTYLLLREGEDYKQFEQRIAHLLEKYAGEELKAKGATEILLLQPLKDIYLRPLNNPTGPIVYVYIFSLIAFFMLLIACVNFMNLSTARSANRAREVGMRKVLGANRRKIIRQFMSEAFLLSVLSLILALVIVFLALPQVSTLTNRTLTFDISGISWLLPGLFILIIFVGFAAGSYPALYLSRFKPIKVLTGRLKSGAANTSLRRALVVVQFIISITLIIVTGVMITQLNYLKHRDPGFKKENVVIIPLPDAETRNSIQVVKHAFQNCSGIVSVSASSTIPGWGAPTNDKLPEGYTEAEMQLMDEINVDEDFVPTMGMEMVAGRNFSKEFGVDNKHAILINETAARRYGWENPIGKTIKTLSIEERDSWATKTVIGVVEDFHLRRMSTEIEPLFIRNTPQFPFYFGIFDVVSVRVTPGKPTETIEILKTKWNEIFPDKPFDYLLLEDSFDRQFTRIEESRDIMSYFTLLTIFIACLGLLGLIAFSAERRTKEIGIRKVLGSSTPKIVMLLSKEFLLLVCFANLFAWPVAYFILNEWLEGFPYRTDLTVVPFMLSAFAVLVISYLTIAYQAIKAANSKPVDSLRYE